MSTATAMSSTTFVPSTYERIIPSNIPYWISWPAIGVIAFVAGEVLVRIYHSGHYFLTQLLMSIGLCTVPIAYIKFSHYFQKTMRAIHHTFWESEEIFNEWLINRSRRIFTFSSWQSIVITSLITIPGIITVLASGLPSRFRILNIFGLAFFTGILILCGQGLYMCLDLLSTLRETTLRPARVPFFRMANRVIAKLQTYYSFVAITVTVAYIGLVITIWRSPYGLSLAMQIWLTILAFYPLSLFLVSYFHLHILMQNIKYSHLDVINKEVQAALERMLYSTTLEDAQRLEKVMDIQLKVQAMKEWPIGSQGTIAFLFTFLTAAAQVTISILKASKP